MSLAALTVGECACGSGAADENSNCDMFLFQNASLMGVQLAPSRAARHRVLQLHAVNVNDV